MIKKSWTHKFLFFLILVIMVTLFMGPLVWQLLTALKPETALSSLPPLFPQEPTLEHFYSIFTDHPFLKIIGNSLIIASATTLLSLLLGSLAAFALAWIGFKGKGLLLFIALAISMFPPISIVSPLYLLVRALDLRDTWWALIIVHTTFSLPLTLWILTSFFRDIPGEIYKAALMDGCSPFQAFFRILLPLSAPGLAAAAILVFIFSWNEFLFALSFTTTEASRTIPVGIALFPGLHEIPYGDIAAASITVTLPIILIVFLFQKKIVAGITAGSVKG